MTDQKPALSLRYALNLEESQDGFGLATFGKKQITRFLTPLISLGIIVYGVIVELAGVWFVTDKVRYTTGLLIGISLACGMAVNIATVLRDAVELYGEDNAKKKIVAKSLLRYAVVVIVFFVMMKWNLGNLITAFIGVLGLKVSAYLQPFTHRVIQKLQGRGDVSSDSEDNNFI